VKFASDKAGFIDLAMDPTDPNVLFASSWERERGPYYLQSGGPGSALWKTTDAGRTWREVKGGGFPEAMKGRIGLAIAPSNPRYVGRGGRGGFFGGGQNQAEPGDYLVAIKVGDREARQRLRIERKD